MAKTLPKSKKSITQSIARNILKGYRDGVSNFGDLDPIKNEKVKVRDTESYILEDGDKNYLEYLVRNYDFVGVDVTREFELEGRQIYFMVEYHKSDALNDAYDIVHDSIKRISKMLSTPKVMEIVKLIYERADAIRMRHPGLKVTENVIRITPSHIEFLTVFGSNDEELILKDRSLEFKVNGRKIGKVSLSEKGKNDFINLTYNSEGKRSR